MNLATLVDEKAAQFGERVLAVFDDDTVTYAQAAERAGHVAAGLKDLGVTEGERVAIMMGNRSEFLYAWFGILKLAAIEVPIHDAARGPGISHILNTTESRVLIVEDVFLEHVLPWLRPGGSELFHGRRGWHRSGRFPADLQLLLAGAILGALVAPPSRAV